MFSRKFTIRIKPYIGESLWSFLFRFAQNNEITMLTLLKLVYSGGSDIQNSEAIRLDLSPKNVVDVEKLSFTTGISSDKLLNMSMHFAVKTFWDTEDIWKSRMLSGMITKNFRYCPQCLKEKPYYRLLWKVENIKCCPSHGIPLLEGCFHCGNEIKFHEIQQIDSCPKCGEYLHDRTDWSPDKMMSVTCHHMEVEAWTTLIHSKVTALNPEQIATRILYLLNEKNSSYSHEKVKRKFESPNVLTWILQCARGALQNKGFHLSHVFSALRNCQESMASFLQIQVPSEFQSSILPNHVETERSQIMNQLFCLAPWCPSNNVPGSLIITSASVRSGKGRYLCLSCRDCDCKYVLNRARSDDLEERTVFIKAHRVVSGLKLDLLNPIMLSQKTGLTMEQIIDCLAYFSTRRVMPWANWCQIEAEPELLNRVEYAINEGASIDCIQTWDCWRDHLHFSVHHYHPDTMKAMTQKRKRRPESQEKEMAGKERVPQILGQLMERDESITVSKVASMLEVSEETLRGWGCSKRIAEAKREQRQQRITRMKEHVMGRAETYFLQNTHQRIQVDGLYGFIGVKKSAVYKVAPEITAYIGKKLKEHNLDSRKGEA